MKLVLKLGGFAFPGEPSAPTLEPLTKVIGRLAKSARVVVITGGGEVARKYIEAARQIGASEAYCDQLGIYVTRVNARLLIAGLGELAYPEVPETLEQLLLYFTSGRVVVMGGLQPGQSTNAVAAIAAESVGAKLLVNATDIDALYSGDPARDPSAKRLEEVTTPQLERILSKQEVSAGAYDLMDPVAVKVIERSKIPTIIVDGRNPENIFKVFRGKKIGTRIVHR